MYCKNCGKVLPDGGSVKFCPFCGEEIFMEVESEEINQEIVVEDDINESMECEISEDEKEEIYIKLHQEMDKAITFQDYNRVAFEFGKLGDYKNAENRRRICMQKADSIKNSDGSTSNGKSGVANSGNYDFSKLKATSEEAEQILSERTSFFENIFMKIAAIAILIGIIIFAKNKWEERQFYKDVYEQAEKSIRKDLSGAYNLEIESYDSDNISQQARWEMHDFGYGNLRYCLFIVKPHIEYDAAAGHMDYTPNIFVYYYTSDQNISEGVDESVEPHFVTKGINANFNDMFSDLYEDDTDYGDYEFFDDNYD